MSIPTQSMPTWAACMTVLHVAAAASTIYRVSLRYRNRQMWWDEYLVIAALSCDVPYFITLWLRVELDTTVDVRTDFFYISTTLFFCVVWCARMSMSLSLARISPPGPVKRRLIALTILFGVMGAVLSLQMMILCSNDGTAWHYSIMSQCDIDNWIAVLVGDILADIILIIVPCVMLWHITLPQSSKQLILSVFAADICVTLASVARYTMLWGPQSWGSAALFLSMVFGHLQATICVLVCNLLVIATTIYRFLRGIRTRNLVSLSPKTAEERSMTTAAPQSDSKSKMVVGYTTTELNQLSFTMSIASLGGTSHALTDKTRMFSAVACPVSVSEDDEEPYIQPARADTLGVLNSTSLATTQL